MLTIVIIFIVGLCIGSFLNVCIWRLPREESIIRPPSHCIRCKHKLSWYENIPLVSYIVLGGRCRHCKKKISFRYFLVELLTASLLVGLFLRFGLGWPFLIYGTLVCGLIAITFIDFKHRIIPDEIDIPGMILGLILSFAYPALHGLGSRFSALLASAMGLLVGGGFIYLTGLLGDFVFKKETMGGGDVKLLAMVGAFIGWKLALMTIFLGCLSGSIVGLPLRIMKKQEHIPFGPFLSLGVIISIFWGSKILGWILW